MAKRFIWIAGGSFLVVLALALSGIYWFYRSYEDPGNVFWGMVGNNLRTGSVTKEVARQTGYGTTNDTMQLIFNPAPRVHVLRQISSGGTELTVESLNTPTVSYQHYLKIVRPVAAGKESPDYSRLYKLWLKEPTDSSPSSLFGNALFGVTLIGEVPKVQQAAILESLHKAYQVNTGSAKLSTSGRRTYTYDVTINLKQYAQAVRAYAKALGLPSANQIRPGDYKSTDKAAVAMSVDAASRHLTKVVYKNGNLTETYSGYDIAPSFTPPATTVTPAHFEKTFDAVLGS